MKIWTGPGPSVRLIFYSRNGLTCWVAAGRGYRWQLDKTTLVREQGTSPAAPRYCHDSAGDSWPRQLNTRPAERERESFSAQKRKTPERWWVHCLQHSGDIKATCMIIQSKQSVLQIALSPSEERWIRLWFSTIDTIMRFILTMIFTSGGPLSALTCCVNIRLLSAIKKNIAVNLFSKLGWELGLYYASYDDFHPDILARMYT